MDRTIETEQKAALVTGGSNGIGYAISLKLATNGIYVFIADVVPPERTHPNIKFIACDVTGKTDIDNLYATLAAHSRLPDILVLNAGKGIHEKLTEGDPEKWTSVISLNIMGALRCIRAFVPAMEKKPHADIVFVSSISAFQPYAYGGIYGPSKAALEMIAQTLRLEISPDVRITIVSAGLTLSSMTKGSASYDHAALSADDIADDVWYALGKHRKSVINKIVTRPFDQDF